MKRLCEALTEYAKRGNYPCHMPGHKGSSRYSFLGDILKYDITEIDGLDNLHDANGVIAASQDFAAKLYGAGDTYFLVNGSTAGIMSAITGTISPGDKVLIARNCHSSVYNAVREGRLRCRYLYPGLVDGYDMFADTDPTAVENAFDKEPDISAVVITSPTYEGIVSDIERIADTVHRHGAILIVDEAHGAHFGFSHGFPETANRKGADIVINSVHKTLPAPTQTALLHVNGDRVDKEAIKRRLKIYQSSSPSYLLMAGIDNCMTVLYEHGDRLFEELYHNLNVLKEQTEKLENIDIIGRDTLINGSGVFDLDPCKLSIQAKGRSGRWLYDELRLNHGIQPEMAAGSHCLLIMSIMDSGEGFDRIKNALLCIDEKIDSENETVEEASYITEKANGKSIYGIRCDRASEIYETAGRTVKVIDIKEAAGYESADIISVYPPGIPLIVPGEVINDELIGALLLIRAGGMNIQGMTKDGKISIYE
ncbi:MAG: aminotransferase class I/II-fold pyridoxal phosphate-dependent enzyme [Lachnospiraceae bacterium]|nr:aminotransferase class I/II-fold pyridoxal phosphate-dependent enzyme [Lachnospiraceae bacterium]